MRLNSGASWFALQVIPRREGRVAGLLQYKGYEQFVPMCRLYRRWTDRTKLTDSPLFPGYVFCRMASGATGLVVTTPGVIRVVGAGRQPCPISNSEIEAIRKIALVQDATPVPYLRVGQRVHITEGPLSGITGILTSIENQRKLVLSVDLIMRSVSVKIGTVDTIVLPESESAAA
jgi:transcription antitermination factor NusG